MNMANSLSSDITVSRSSRNFSVNHSPSSVRHKGGNFLVQKSKQAVIAGDRLKTLQKHRPLLISERKINKTLAMDATLPCGDLEGGSAQHFSVRAFGDLEFCDSFAQVRHRQSHG